MLRAPSFESRIWPQSRPSHIDDHGNVVYEHNSPLELGETVEPVLGGPEMIVVKSGYRNLISRQELVTVAEKLAGGGEGVWTEMLASAVRRVSKRPRARP